MVSEFLVKMTITKTKVLNTGIMAHIVNSVAWIAVIVLHLTVHVKHDINSCVIYGKRRVRKRSSNPDFFFTSAQLSIQCMKWV